MRESRVMKQQNIQIFRGHDLQKEIKGSVTRDEYSAVTGMIRYQKLWRNAYFIPSENVWKLYL